MILGIDEVGRGPWAGPLVVGAVVLGEKFQNFTPTEHPGTSEEQELFQLWQRLTDSKKLTNRAREELNKLILQHTAAYGLGWVSAAELDTNGLSKSLMLATRRAVKQVLATKVKFDQIIIDGTINFLKNTPLEIHTTTLKKADLTVKEVSAASIIAKVARDHYMAEIALQYPAYGFEKHVGYGTALHQENLQKHGICPEHRQSFRPIKEIMIKFPPKTPIRTVEGHFSQDLPKPPSTSQKGQTAEFAVASYLKRQNHKIITKNFKTKTYEIDLISIKNHQIFFTEVKYSQNPQQEGTALVRITPKKLEQMTFAAQAFISQHPEFKNFEPLLAIAAVHGKNFHVADWIALD